MDVFFSPIYSVVNSLPSSPSRPCPRLSVCPSYFRHGTPVLCSRRYQSVCSSSCHFSLRYFHSAFIYIIRLPLLCFCCLFLLTLTGRLFLLFSFSISIFSSFISYFLLILQCQPFLFRPELVSQMDVSVIFVFF